MTKRISDKHQQLGSPRGSITRQAIIQFDALAAKVVSEFKSEPCPEDQAEVRPALICLLETTVGVALRDAERLTETLPGEAIAALDKAISALRVIELTKDTLDEEDADGLKEKAISLVKLLLPLIPKKFDWVRKLIEVVLDLIVLLQKNQ